MHMHILRFESSSHLPVIQMQAMLSHFIWMWKALECRSKVLSWWQLQFGNSNHAYLLFGVGLRSLQSSMKSNMTNKMIVEVKWPRDECGGAGVAPWINKICNSPSRLAFGPRSEKLPDIWLSLKHSWIHNCIEMMNNIFISLITFSSLISLSNESKYVWYIGHINCAHASRWFGGTAKCTSLPRRGSITNYGCGIPNILSGKLKTNFWWCKADGVSRRGAMEELEEGGSTRETNS